MLDVEERRDEEREKGTTLPMLGMPSHPSATTLVHALVGRELALTSAPDFTSLQTTDIYAPTWTIAPLPPTMDAFYLHLLFIFNLIASGGHALILSSLFYVLFKIRPNSFFKVFLCFQSVMFSAPSAQTALSALSKLPHPSPF